MSTLSPGYKPYKIEGSNLSIPGWLIQHRGPAVDKAISAATNALVGADATRNKVFRDDANRIESRIDSSKSFSILSIIPVEIPTYDGHGSTSFLDNQFVFSPIDDRFLDKSTLNFADDVEIRQFLRYKSRDVDTQNIKSPEELVAEFREENPTLATLWGTIKAARDLLQSEPYCIARDTDPYKVLLTNPDNELHYGKITANHLADTLNETWDIDLVINANDPNDPNFE